MYENVLVPTDGSDGASQAVDRALDLANTYGATIHALYVVEPVYTTDYQGGQIIDALRAEGDRATGEIADRCEEQSLPVTTAVRTGTPHKEILEYADEEDIDLIVMGTHGRTGFDRYLLGSVTEKVVRLSDVPVLTVSMRPDEGE